MKIPTYPIIDYSVLMGSSHIKATICIDGIAEIIIKGQKCIFKKKIENYNFHEWPKGEEWEWCYLSCLSFINYSDNGLIS